MAMFNSYVKLPEGISPWYIRKRKAIDMHDIDIMILTYSPMFHSPSWWQFQLSAAGNKSGFASKCTNHGAIQRQHQQHQQHQQDQQQQQLVVLLLLPTLPE